MRPDKKIYIIIFLFCLFKLTASAQKLNKPISVGFLNSARAFPLVKAGHAANIYIDTADAEVVSIASKCFSKDILQVTGNSAAIKTDGPVSSEFPVIAGTIGHSRLIDQLIRQHKIDVDKVTGKWETFSISIVNNPLPNVKKALVITGSDRRGTAYGFFELSRMIGVSPLVWWADVAPKHQEELYVSPGTSIVGPPSVKFRGIFLNDEDWGLQPWAAKNMDKDLKDIGPNTYAHIFELLLRLKANYIWPAMHPCTKAFWFYKQNPEVADKYAIVLGSSHCEPILRNNVFEWDKNFQNEFSHKPGEWRYDVNKDEIYNYWDVRAKESANIDAVYTVGMRGISDGNMAGPESKPERVKLLENIITDQRSLLSKEIGKPANLIPQIFCPYKEVLNLYQMNMKLPDDITIVWADDNHGYIRQLSDPAEQKRPGGSGVYYHLSYWGSPRDYLWLESTSPSLISYEMSKAYRFGADKVWIFNVGDIKPAEMEIQFAMDLAWNVGSWTPEKAYTYPYSWASETFGKKFAKSIAHIKSTYYRLASAAKPEHTDAVSFTETEVNQRLANYQKLRTEAETLSHKIPVRLQDAYFELILYPVTGACLMNEKIYYAKKSIILDHPNTRQEALAFAQQSKDAYDEIQQITKKYNEVIANGKWNGIMSDRPRDLDVFNMPRVATKENAEDSEKSIEIRWPASPLSVIPADQFVSKRDVAGTHIEVIDGLGINGKSVTVMPVVEKSYSNDIQSAPYLNYKVNLKQGTNTFLLKFLPTFRLYNGFGLKCAVAVNDGPPQIINIDASTDSKSWSENVLRGYSVGQITAPASKTGPGTLRIYLLDPSLVLSQIEIK
jgi:hypothetical protein